MENQRGQVLLIIILLSTVLLTIGLSVSQITTQETQIAKLEEESKKAFAAVEAGLDARLKSGSDITNIASILPPNSGIISGQATTDPTPKSTFITPLLKKDEQYTFYLADYDIAANSFSAYFSGDLIFYLGNSSSCPTLELTIVSSSNSIRRKLINPSCSTMTASDISNTNSGAPFNFQGVNFDYKTTSSLSIAGDTKLIIVRVLFAETKIGIERISGTSTVLPLQGKTITSDATTSTGVSKKIQLFQSLPQIPADFFITSF